MPTHFHSLFLVINSSLLRTNYIIKKIPFNFNFIYLFIFK